MKIQIIGTGCSKCKALENNVKKAAANLSLDAELVKITDIDEIIDKGVMIPPDLGIDGEIKLMA